MIWEIPNARLHNLQPSISNGVGSPYNDHSGNSSQSFIAVSLQRDRDMQRGIPPANGIRNSGTSSLHQHPISPLSPYPSESKSAFSSRTVPGIAANPMKEVYHAEKPRAGQPYAFRVLAIRSSHTLFYAIVPVSQPLYEAVSGLSYHHACERRMSEHAEQYFHPFPYPQVPGTPQQNVQTHPPSPSMKPALPDLRPSMHRFSAADSSSSNHRSHSQPAKDPTRDRPGFFGRKSLWVVKTVHKDHHPS